MCAPLAYIYEELLYSHCPWRQYIESFISCYNRLPAHRAWAQLYFLGIKKSEKGSLTLWYNRLPAQRAWAGRSTRLLTPIWAERVERLVACWWVLCDPYSGILGILVLCYPATEKLGIFCFPFHWWVHSWERFEGGACVNSATHQLTSLELNKPGHV